MLANSRASQAGLLCQNIAEVAARPLAVMPANPGMTTQVELTTRWLIEKKVDTSLRSE